MGAIRTDCPPAAATSIIASMATTVLPDPTSPWTSRVMRCPEARSPPISIAARVCAPVSWKGRAACAVSESGLRRATMAGIARPAPLRAASAS